MMSIGLLTFKEEEFRPLKLADGIIKKMIDVFNKKKEELLQFSHGFSNPTK